MIRPPRSHCQYLEFVQTRRAALEITVPHDATTLWCKFRHTNLAAAYPILARLYVADQGRPARPPDDLLRAWLLMLECHITSIDLWVPRLREQPFYALLCGFEPDDVPGVGTFYDFQDRLLQCAEPVLDRDCVPRRRSEQRKTSGTLRDKNNTAPHAQILDRLAERLLTRPARPVIFGQWHTNLAVLPAYQRPLKEVFYTVFVATSVTKDLIDLADLSVAGDGTHLATWANAHGHKLCPCDNRANPHADHCTCARRFHDPHASWGWDSYRECYVYGHGLYELTAYSLRHTCQLPLVINVLDNHRHDSVAYLAAMHEAVDLLGFRIQTASLDKAHDALALYRLGTEHWHSDSVIPLNARNTDHVQFAPALRLTEEGIPICLAEQPLIYQGLCTDRLRLKWRCPRAVQHLPLTDCPHFAHDCSDSTYGRTIYTYPKTNYRLFTRLPRGSLLWELHADRRSCAERSIKRKKLDFGLDHTCIAGRERWFFRMMLAAMCQHLDAWSTHSADH
jgi:Transposase domain (DUF772)